MKDLRSFLRDLERTGEPVREVTREVHHDRELAAVVKLLEPRGNPVAYFHRVAGAEMPVIAGVHGTRERIALALDSPVERAVDDYLARLEAVQPKELPEDLDLFDEVTARRGMRLNKAAYSLKDAEQRELFARDEEAWMEQFGLTDEERELIRRRDWIGLWRAGMSIYVMVKLSGVTGTPLPEIGRQMRESG